MRKWNKVEDELIKGKLSEGKSEWEVAKDLSNDLKRSKRSVDSRARRLKNELSSVSGRKARRG